MSVSFLFLGLLIQIVLVPTAIYANERTTQIRDANTGFTCNSDSDCSNQGTCDTTRRTCSCFSGFGNTNRGYDCATKPSSSCSSSYQTPSSTSNSFSPSLTFNLADNYLSVEVIAALDNNMYINPWDSSLSTRDSSQVYSVETTIEFAGSQYCNYPPPSASTPPWAKNAAASGSCSDSYALEMLWSQARDNCGFVYNSALSAWTTSVTVSRKYLVPFNTQSDYKRDVLPRIESATFDLKVNFPSIVNASTSDNAVTVSGPTTVFSSALALVNYNSASAAWELKLETFTNRPYQLSNPVASSKGDSSLVSRFSLTKSSNVSSCNSNLQGCSQSTSFFFKNCDALRGTFVATFTPICSEGDNIKNCAHPNGNVDVTISLSTARACSVADTVQFQQKALTAYSTAALSATASNFTASGIAYFGAVITTTDATIYNRTLKSVCMILNPASGNVNCINVDFTLLTPGASGSNDPKFSINLAQTRTLTNETTAQSFRVVAIIGIVWSSAKRQVEQEETATVTDLDITPQNNQSSSSSSSSESSMETNKLTSTSAASGSTSSSTNSTPIETPEKESDNTNSNVAESHDDSKLKMALVAALSGVCGLFIIVVVLIIFIAHKRRQGKRAAEASFNFSEVSN
uniref:Predicted protein n=1 Tax=Hordeum vulgare subsp. vulgare TaxID=112509 RepID=F2DFM4_HORVV|nr:predicted protein [Hordeum vulgare subsp. vulgare]